MSPSPLAQARHVWHALFLAGVRIEADRWVAWADARIASGADAPADWLCLLSQAQVPEAAHAAVSEGIGLEDATEALICRQSLVIGLVVGRHLAGEITSEDMWVKLNEVDVAEFLDSGKWRQYATSIGECDAPPTPLHCLLPVARFARAQAFAILQWPES